MSTIAELKNNLHKLIVETDDLNVLKKVEEAFILLRAESANRNSLSKQEQEMIERGITAMDEGEVVSDEAAKNQFAKWLNRNNE